MIRRLLLGSLVLLTTGYLGGAFYFYTQERHAWAPLPIGGGPTELHHPEAILGAIRQSFETHDYSDGIRAHLERSLLAVPASYQSSFLTAVYRANRLGDPRLVRRSFENALRLFPANGRLHLTYARWLLTSPPLTPGDKPPSSRLALTHIQKAIVCEQDLLNEALHLLKWSDTPPSQWTTLLPNDPWSRRQLIDVLAKSGHQGLARNLLKEMVDSTRERAFLREAAHRALGWGDPQLALEAARSGLEQEQASGKAGIEMARAALLVARAHMALGDFESAYRVFRATSQEMEASRPARLELITGMGDAYLKLGETLLARSMFLKARQLAPFQTAPALGLARTHLQSGERTAAIELYREVLELAPDHAEAQRKLGQLLLEQRPIPESR